jgi:hypothetical protein
LFPTQNALVAYVLVNFAVPCSASASSIFGTVFIISRFRDNFFTFGLLSAVPVAGFDLSTLRLWFLPSAFRYALLGAAKPSGEDGCSMRYAFTIPTDLQTSQH